MNQAHPSVPPLNEGLTGRHVLVVVTAFFAIVFIVNGVLLWKALATHSGLVANEPYRKGLAYNNRIAADERQVALGWNATLEASRAGKISLSLVDPSAHPVTQLDIRGLLARPSSSNADALLKFAEQAPGVYVATSSSIAAGTWRIDIEAWSIGAEHRSGNEPIYRARRRLWIMP